MASQFAGGTIRTEGDPICRSSIIQVVLQSIMNEAEDSNEDMQKNEDREKNSLSPVVDQPKADFLAELHLSCGIMSEAALWGGGSLEALQPMSLCFVALVVSSIGGSVRKVETRGVFRSHSSRTKKLKLR